MIRLSLRCGRGPAAPRSSKDDDTGPGYYDTLAGGIWPPAPGGQQARARAPGGPSAIGHHNAL